MSENDDNKPCSNPAFTPERIAAAHAETERFCRELDITNADHVLLWLESHINDDYSIGFLACKIVEAHEEIVNQSKEVML